MKQVTLNFLHFCDAANIDSLGKVSILGIFSKVFVNTVPSKFPRFSIVFNLGFKNLEQTKNTVEVKIFNPDKEEVSLQQPIVVEFMVKEEDIKKEGDMNLILEIANIEFKSLGKHTVRIHHNGDEIGSKYFLVEERKVN